MMKSYHFRILAVDDERPILDLYPKILCQSRKDSGSSSSVPSFDLTLCEQAQEAVEEVWVSIEEDRPFAVVFINIHLLPEPDGVWAAEKIRKLDRNVGIVLVTGYLDTDLREVERRVPPPDKLFYLQKPFDLKEIWQFASFLCAKWISEIKLRAIQAHLDFTVEKRTSALEVANKKLREEIENRIKAENRVRASEENFRNIIASNADGIVILDEDQIVRFINPAAESLFGRKADVLIDQPFGYPMVAGETAEFDIVSGDEGPVVAEIRLTKTKWEGKAALLASLRDITAHKRTKEDLQLSLNKLQKTMRGTVQAVASTVDKRDLYTAGHQQRVADLSRLIAQEIGLSSGQVEDLYLAAVVHDLGKISVPAEILFKPARLTDLEFKMIQLHAEVGYQILKPIEFPRPIAKIVLQHHEKMDGSGYPRGLSGEEIMMEARIIGVADVVEAMAFHRPYRPALGVDKALEEIRRNRGVRYDPDVVDACGKVFTHNRFEFNKQ